LFGAGGNYATINKL